MTTLGQNIPLHQSDRVRNGDMLCLDSANDLVTNKIRKFIKRIFDTFRYFIQKLTAILERKICWVVQISSDGLHIFGSSDHLIPLEFFICNVSVTPPINIG